LLYTGRHPLPLGHLSRAALDRARSWSWERCEERLGTSTTGPPGARGKKTQVRIYHPPSSRAAAAAAAAGTNARGTDPCAAAEQTRMWAREERVQCFPYSAFLFRCLCLCLPFPPAVPCVCQWWLPYACVFRSPLHAETCAVSIICVCVLLCWPTFEKN
jgi:hypothetical protein